MNKVLIVVRPSGKSRGKAKFCTHCGEIATQEALFSVDESVILKDIVTYCIKNVK